MSKGHSRTSMEAFPGALAEHAGSASHRRLAPGRVSRVSARRYLEHVVAEGMRSAVAPKYGGGTGRPENCYLWIH